MKTIIIGGIVLLPFIVEQGLLKTDNEILQKTMKKLEQMQIVECSVEFENYNPFNGELGEHNSAKAYYDFTSTDTIIGAKYFIESEKYNYGYNGTTSFYSKKDGHQIVYQNVNFYEDLIGKSFLTFSIPWLRNSIPKILNDETILITKSEDIKITNTECYQFNITIAGKGFDKDGQLTLIESNAVRNYKLIIDKATSLPRQFIQLSSDNTPTWIIGYHSFNHLTSVSQSIFNHFEQDVGYTVFTQLEYRAFMERNGNNTANAIIGSKAMDWVLPQIGGDSVQLSSLNSNLILIEFWFPYCTGCIKAIPEINKIQDTYKDKGLKVYGIEYTKSGGAGLGEYISKWKIEYPTLYLGGEVAKKYGVKGGPTVFLINEEGQIVYMTFGFNRRKLIEAIEENI